MHAKYQRYNHEDLVIQKDFKCKKCWQSTHKTHYGQTIPRHKRIPLFPQKYFRVQTSQIITVFVNCLPDHLSIHLYRFSPQFFLRNTIPSNRAKSERREIKRQEDMIQTGTLKLTQKCRSILCWKHFSLSHTRVYQA